MLGSVLFLLIALYSEVVRPTVAFFIVVVFLNVVGILKPSDVLHGFANEQLAVIILFLIISDIVRKSSVVDAFFYRILGTSGSLKPFLGRMMVIVALFSTMFNNTPLVAMMMPHVSKWGRQHKVSVSQLLIPLSFATILGGCITLVGTSTNLIVNGMAVEAGLGSLEIFDFALVGLPMLVIGILYIQFFGRKLLPDTSDAVEEFMEHARDYLLETQVMPSSSLIGKTVEEARLRNLKGIFLVEIMRNNELITPIAPEERLREGDVLIFSGNTNFIDELKDPLLGLTLPKECEHLFHKKQVVSEVVISHNSYLIGRKIKNSDFRGKYDGAVVAVHRNGEKLSGKIGDISLKAGDVLLVFGGKDFQKRTAGNQAFYFISESVEPENVNIWKVSTIVGGVLLSIVLSAFGIIKLFTGLLIILLVAIFMKIVPLHEIRKGLDFNLLFLLALGLALGRGMLNSGTAEFVAQGILGYVDGLEPVMIIGGIFIVTNVFSAYVTNKAAVAILFPVSILIGQRLALPLEPFILVVAFGAAANFITPIGYQTNLMVYGPGGYTFKDFMRIGLPLTLLYALVCTLVLGLTYKLF